MTSLLDCTNLAELTFGKCFKELDTIGLFVDGNLNLKQDILCL